MSSRLNEESCGAGFCPGCRDTPVEQARLQVWRSVASWFGLGSWRWMAWLKKRLYVSRSGWLLAVATKHTERERPSPVSERRPCCLVRSSDLAFRRLNGEFRSVWLFGLVRPVRQLLIPAQLDRRHALDAPESDDPFSVSAFSRL